MGGQGLALLRALIRNPVEGLGFAKMTSLKVWGQKEAFTTQSPCSVVRPPAADRYSSSSTNVRNAAAPLEASSHGLSFSRWFNGSGWRQIIILSPYLWLIAFFFIPFLIIVWISLAKTAPVSPPFEFKAQFPYVYWEGYARLFTDTLYVRAYFISAYNAAIATALCLLLGYPMALGLTRVGRFWRSFLLTLVILPFWTSFLLRVYAWMGLMGSNSWLNRGLTAAWNMLVPQAWDLNSIPMMNSNFAVILVMVYTYLPFMILPLYANLEKLDNTLNEAAMDLGSRPSRVFRDITLPLSLPGIVAGGLLVFIPASGELVIPSLVGNSYDPMIGRVISDQFSSARDWPMAATVAVALLILLVVPTMIYAHFEAKAQAARQED
ncbi:MAG: ABC transporter permease [Mesorhizobium sp.]|nr:MAG: ABC transporter permease [Mesorhizobium sp.]RWG96582.1 MAG: ABC transporter permease [Mesorhizobium sp.]TIN48729.1 MAG: ABC transporter permease [Mesorhizobium sp.]TIR91636.1 MAG: ABC transporter permease [Mesorhizobium sp.]TIS04506.1 MAG: ABC transporter permease [Mesorhizobium sp.]